MVLRCSAGVTGVAMKETNGEAVQPGAVADSEDSLEATLGQLFREQRGLREQLETVRTELERVNREILKVQEEFCTDAQREEVYQRCLERLLGFDPGIDAKEIDEAGQDGPPISELI